METSSMIKNFMRVTFPKLLDIFVIVSFIGCVLLSILYAGIITSSGAGVVAGFFVFLLSLCLGTVGIIVSFGVIYVLLDIRDSLQHK